MKILLKPLIKGAFESEGIAVIIDVFRAFSLECYLYHYGAREVIPVESIEEGHKIMEKYPEAISCGERQGLIQRGYEYGNSPYYLRKADVKGKRVIHASSSGTRGFLAALNSRTCEVITGSYVNAAAVANYIKKRKAEIVSLVPMGWAGERMTKEDLYCAEYIRGLLLNEQDRHKDYMMELYETDGKRFFDGNNQESMPIADFFLCLQKNIFDFVLKADKNKDGIAIASKITVNKD